MPRKSPARKRTHQFVITIVTDKPCTKSHALVVARDCIHGEFYPTQFDDDDPGEFRVRSFKPVPAKGNRKSGVDAWIKSFKRAE